MKKIITRINSIDFYKYFYLLAFLFLGFNVFGQLSSGDIAFIQYNSDNTDNFKFVTLVDIPANEVIKFTDNEYSDLAGGEGTITWTAPATGLNAGTIITITTTPTASAGIVTESNNLVFSTSGDNLIAYQGTTTTPSFLAALGNDGATAGNWSDTEEGSLPTGLTNGTDAVALSEVDNAKYDGSILSGTKSELLSAINNPNNWTGSDLTNQTFTGSFNITSVSAITNFIATPINKSKIDLSWTQNSNSDDVIIVFDTDGSFSDPIDGNTYSGSALGGTVIYNGSATSYSHTSLTLGTRYYYKAWSVDGSNNYSSGVTAETEPLPEIWINEIHYENDGTDQNEFIEIALANASSYTLNNFTVYLYNGVGGIYYESISLNNFTPGANEGNITLYSFSTTIQNGPDGMAVSWNDGTTEHLIQFLSYEGAFSATDGPANGQTSIDIAVNETSTTTAGYSLQLVDISGSKAYGDYEWSGPVPATEGASNSDGINNQTLPIELTSFKAQKQSSHNLILWTTSSEINNAYFTLEKSYNAKDFFEIDNVKGAGNSKTINLYHSKDYDITNSVVYYRLKQTDFDGVSSYSNIISLQNNFELIIENNYFNGNEFVINLKSNTYNNIKIKLYDINGRLILSENKNLSKGNNKYKFNMQNLPNGVYMLKIQSENHNINSKVIKY